MEPCLPFSSAIRTTFYKQAHQTTFDLVILGGGITGAGIAMDAALRGLKVCLIEQAGFASGTSSRSTKLIHGGLRYLEKLQFAFVAKLGRERERLYQNAPHLVVPTPVVLPIVKGGTLNKPLTAMALTIYDVLAGVPKAHKTKWVDAEKLVARYPFIEAKNLKGGFVYYEYKTNDGRLVVELLKTAVNNGALPLNYTKVQNIESIEKNLFQIQITDVFSDATNLIKTRAVVNATGPNCQNTLMGLGVSMPKDIYPTKGVHLVFKKSDFPLNDAFYFDAPQNRMVFAIPKHDHVYVGTTDTPFNGNVLKPMVSAADVDYLLLAVNAKFSGLNLSKKHIVSCWAGIRPLIHQTGKAPSEVSRRDEIFVSENGIITITGGKLTGYRLMAKKTVDLVLKKLSQTVLPCQTAHFKLSGSEWPNSPTLQKLIELADQKFDEAKQTGIEPQHFKKLFYRYGSNIDILTEKAYIDLRLFPNAELLWFHTEIWYMVHHEMATTLSDLFTQYTEMVLFEPHKVAELLPFAAKAMGELFCWDEAEIEKQMARFYEYAKQFSVE